MAWWPLVRASASLHASASMPIVIVHGAQTLSRVTRALGVVAPLACAFLHGSARRSASPPCSSGGSPTEKAGVERERQAGWLSICMQGETSGLETQI